MKKFTLYESFSSVDDDILERSEQKTKKLQKTVGKKWGTLVACCCVMLIAFSALNPLHSFHNDSSQVAPDNNISDSASNPEPLTDSYVSSDTGNVQPRSNGNTDINAFPDSREKGKKRSTNAVVDETLTLSEAQTIEPFGSYIFSTVPSGFTLESIQRYQDDNNNYLLVLWTKGTGSFDEISCKISLYDETYSNRVTPVANTENYDLSLYTFPLMDSVPEKLFEVVEHPIFDVKELTLDVVNSRAYSLNESDSRNETAMSFGVLYGDIVVEVTAKGISSEWLHEQLIELDSSTNRH